MDRLIMPKFPDANDVEGVCVLCLLELGNYFNLGSVCDLRGCGYVSQRKVVKWSQRRGGNEEREFVSEQISRTIDEDAARREGLAGRYSPQEVGRPDHTGVMPFAFILLFRLRSEGVIGNEPPAIGHLPYLLPCEISLGYIEPGIVKVVDRFFGDNLASLDLDEMVTLIYRSKSHVNVLKLLPLRESDDSREPRSLEW